MTGSMVPDGVRADGLPAAPSDRRRLAAVRATGLLDAEPEQAFDHLADLAAAITGCERAFITLVAENRSLRKSCIGVDVQEAGKRRIRPGRAFAISWPDWAVGSSSMTPRRICAPAIIPLSRRRRSGRGLATRSSGQAVRSWEHVRDRRESSSPGGPPSWPAWNPGPGSQQ